MNDQIYGQLARSGLLPDDLARAILAGSLPPLEDIVIRLAPSSRYTTTNKEGGFTFYNVREGDFELALDPKTLPEGGALSSPAAIPVAVRVGAAPPTLEFTFVVNTTQKPIRKVLDRK